MIVQYTPEQIEILYDLKENDGIRLVSAGAGSGKTWLSKQIITELNPKSVLYTAFNKAIVQEGVDRFKGLNVTCKTFHALAYHYVKPTSPINDLTYSCIEEDISYAKRGVIINTINNLEWCNTN